MGDPERRESPRVPLRLTLFIRNTATGKAWRVLSNDISGLGARFTTEEQLEVKTPLEVEIKLPDQATPISCKAEVVWNRVTPPQKSYEWPMTEVGIGFLDLTPKDRVTLKQYSAMNAPPPGELG